MEENILYIHPVSESRYEFYVLQDGYATLIAINTSKECETLFKTKTKSEKGSIEEMNFKDTPFLLLED